MATLHCRHCNADIDSDARRPQCRACGALFPFGCAVCDRNLRPPFSVFDDERFLTLDEADLQPLCSDHFLRKCPDCDEWFQADDNPGFFRCLSCAENAQRQNPRLEPEWEEGYYERETAVLTAEPDCEAVSASPVLSHSRFDPNMVVLATAGCAFLALVSWYLLAGH